MTTEEITKFIFIENENPQGDIAVVFGSMYADLPTKIAVDLYLSGKVKTIVFSGSVNKYSGINEAREMASLAEKAGVPAEAILIEDKSTNTLENVLLTKQLLDERMGWEAIHSVVGIMVDCHARRALMTMRKHFPNHVKLCVKTYSFPEFNRSNWFESERGRTLVNKELEKIKLYLAKGDITEV